MIVMEDNFKLSTYCDTYVALGSFDGLHYGHIYLINKVLNLSKNKNVKSMVYAFKNHPLSIINRDLVPKLLMSNEKKVKILEKMGIDIVNFATFDDEFMKMSPETFIQKLIGTYKVKGLVVGFNYRFGYKNLGDVELLNKICRKSNIDLYVIKPVLYKNQIVSSSIIRTLITDGDIEKANLLLTRPYMLSGTVIKGKQLGRQLGFPTVNLNYDANFVIPRGSVYYTYVQYDNKYYKGLTNIGYNPTVDGKKLSIETNILDFKEDIYEKSINIFFINRIRDEKKFSSLEDLTNQMTKDRIYAEKQKFQNINLQ